LQSLPFTFDPMFGRWRQAFQGSPRAARIFAWPVPSNTGPGSPGTINMPQLEQLDRETRV